MTATKPAAGLQVKTSERAGSHRESSPSSLVGTLLTPGPELGGWLVSLLISGLVLGVIEWLGLQAPVPLGGDSGTWTALSYAYIFYPHPSEIVAFGYPPLMFPLLGFLVQLGGGPLVGARLYIALVGVLLGLSVYQLGRALFRRRISALLAQALLFADVPFLRLFFFGGYPTLLAFVFMNLALAFGIRYLRARRPAHLAIFWLATGATLLTHEFVGVVLAVTLVVFGIFLLWKRQLPKGLVFSRVGFASMAVALAGVVAYYLGSRLAHIPQNNYLAQSPVGHLRFSLSSILYALHLQSLGGVIGYNLIRTSNGSFEIAVGLALLIFGTLVGLGISRRRLLSFSILVIGSWVLAVLLMGIGGWILSIYTDYKRFAFALFLPFILGGVFAYDTVFHWCSPVRAPAAPPSPSAPVAGAAPATATRTPRSGFRARSQRGAVLPQLVAVVGTVVLLTAGGVFVYPALVGFQHQYAGNSHSATFLQALQAIAQTGLPGSIISSSSGSSGHWTLALTDRNVYSPTIPSGFVFKLGRVQNDQLAYFALHDRLVVSNGLTYFATTGYDSLFFTGSPIYGALSLAYPTPLFVVRPSSLTVTFANGTTIHANGTGAPMPTIQIVSSMNPQLIFRYAVPGLALTVTSSAIAHTRNATITLSAQATGTSNLVSLAAEVHPIPPPSLKPKVYLNSSSFQWRFPGFQAQPTYGTVDSPALILPIASPESNTSVLPKLTETSLSPSGSRWVNLTLHLSTPGALDLSSPLPATIDTTQTFVQWQARFVLFGNITRGTLLSEALYLETEYGATLLWQLGQWEVLLLPVSFP